MGGEAADRRFRGGFRLGRDSRATVASGDWPRVEWERAEWLRREVEHLSTTLDRVDQRVLDETDARQAAVRELSDRLDDLRQGVDKDRHMDRVWSSHGLPVIVAGIVLGDVAEAVAWLVPWAWVMVAFGVAVVPLAQAMRRRALRKSEEEAARDRRDV